MAADRWSDVEARAAIARWGDQWGEDLALRTYSARLIGGDPALVLHGGGNTSVKSTRRDVFGEELPVLFVKGSGVDLAAIEPSGHPGLQLEYLRRLRLLPDLSDAQMVNAIRTHLLDAASPAPSIETLLHAWLPHKFIDHSHADAILALTNTEAGEALVREVLGDRVAIVPYVKPGFTLAKLAARIFDEHPQVEGLVVMHHGLFTFGETAKESFERHLDLVQVASNTLDRRGGDPPRATVGEDRARERAARLAPLIRGALAERTGGDTRRRWVLRWRGDDRVLGYLSSARLEEWAASGVLTPDHVIYTKSRPLLLEAPTDDEGAWREALATRVGAFRAAYQRYFEENAAATGVGGRPVRLDDTPRVVLVPGVGLFGVGASPEEAAVAADIALHTLAAKHRVDALGGWRSLSPAQIFEIEYWTLEQAKLKSGEEPALARQVAVVTGAAGAIGFGVARALLAAGASVALLDRDEQALERVRQRLDDSRTLAVTADVTDGASMARAFEEVARTFGGVDVVVPNAGIARTATLDTMDEAEFRKVVEVNLTGVFLTLQHAARQMIRQGTGGSVVVISSKNVFAPGEEFGAYSASKAGAHQLGRVAALELARHGIRVNLVTPDAVFSEGDVPSGLWQTVGAERARTRGVDPATLPEHYRQRNLLQTAVTGTHVGNAVVFFASLQTPTTGAVLPVDGGLPAAFPR